MLTENWHSHYMGVGVLPTSRAYYNMVSKFALTNLYYCKKIGVYQCNDEYIIDRLAVDKRVETYHVFFILSGQLHVEYRGISFVADEGDIVVLDCRQPNRYFCNDRLNFVWLSLDGSATAAYFKLLTSRNVPVYRLRNFGTFVSRTLSIAQEMENQTENMHNSSCFWHELLASLACESEKKNTDTKTKVTEFAVTYIREHFAEKLSVEQLAAQCHVSEYHFIRLFKQTQNCTPHEYIINIRLHHSIYLLLNTAMSVTEIALEVGFYSASHFTSCFRKNYGVTPQQYRKRGLES